MTDTQALLEALTGSPLTDAEPSNNGKTKALAWARVSTDMQKERGLSIPEQLREIREYAEKDGIEIVEEYQEAASAFQNEQKRVEFHRMIERAKSDSEINVILVHDFSRFSRDSLRAMTWIKELSQAGVRVISLNDPVVDPETVAGVFMGAITHAKNEAQSREIAFHVRKGCRANIRTRDPEAGWCYKNGGRPLWGYRARHLERGKSIGGRPEYKRVWELDGTVVAGKPLHEWTRECFELALKGAGPADLRDFCNENGIPGRGDKYWSHYSWRELLSLRALLQFAGYGIWNSRTKAGKRLPISEWVIVKNAHPAIITEEEAIAIYELRKARRVPTGSRLCGRTRSSRYLLTGGVFTCARCGKNMISHRTNDGTFYVCSTAKYRKGLGCGPGMYVPCEKVEPEVVSGIKELLVNVLEHTNLVRKINRELREMFARESGHDPGLKGQLAGVEKRIENVRKAILDGLRDVEWANSQLDALNREREQLLARMRTQPRKIEPIQIDLAFLREYLRDLDKVLRKSKPEESKRIVSDMVESMTLDPDIREVVIQYRLPEHLLNPASQLLGDRCVAVR